MKASRAMVWETEEANFIIRMEDITMVSGKMIRWMDMENSTTMEEL